MRKSLFIIAVLLVLGFQKQETGNDYSTNEVLKYLQANTDEGYCIMKAFLEKKIDKNRKINGGKYTNSEYLELFLKNAESTLDSISGVGTLIHETIHGMNKQDFFYYNYFINCNRTIKVKHTSTFKSRKLVEIIPDSCKTIRFDLYIDVKGNYVTQHYGIYGLLDEFLAYYKGVKAEYDFKSTINDSIYFAGIVTSEMQAYYEFKYYIISYLIYAEDNHSRKFNRIMNNNEFKEVFEYVDKNFSILVNKFIDDGGTISWKDKDNYHFIIKTLQTSQYQEMYHRILLNE